MNILMVVGGVIVGLFTLPSLVAGVAVFAAMQHGDTWDEMWDEATEAFVGTLRVEAVVFGVIAVIGGTVVLATWLITVGLGQEFTW